MEIKINSLIPYNGRLKWVEVFGYTSKGQPGLELTGFNGRSRTLKEKMVYLSKRRSLRFPILRYVLCLDLEDLSKCELEWLELPLLIAFWSMTGVLPLKRLDDCFASCKVSLEGNLTHMDFDDAFWESMHIQLNHKKKNVTFIGDGGISAPHCSNINDIRAVDLLNDTVGGFS